MGQTGTISFGVAPSSAPGGRGGPGPAVGRFAELREAAGTIVNTLPAISVFLKPRVSGPRFVKELADKVVVTWTLTESYAGVFDFSWVPTVNRFQAVLHKNGAIDLSYDQLSSQDAIVGLYPMVQSGTEQPLADLSDPDDPAAPAHLDIHSVKTSVVDGLFLKIALKTRGPVLADGDPQLAGVVYRVSMNRAQRTPAADPDLVWTIRGTTQGRGGGGSPRYVTAGPGLLPGSKAAGNTLSVMGTLPALFKTDESIVVSVETTATGPSAAPADTVAAQSVKLSGIRSPEVDLSALGKGDGPFTIVYEAFHHAGLPRPADMACSVIKTLGDRFDFLAWYSDFRVDNQEAGTPAPGRWTSPLRVSGPPAAVSAVVDVVREVSAATAGCSPHSFNLSTSARIRGWNDRPTAA
ncbi:MAG TPA: hypothetical protein VHI99_20455 [Vicinamibacterales bacterium]|nr:hypothetical protein [Vicinamibacterales bacterium]